MDLAQLEVFLTVAREGRFSRAAEKLFRTSRQLVRPSTSWKKNSASLCWTVLHAMAS